MVEHIKFYSQRGIKNYLSRALTMDSTFIYYKNVSIYENRGFTSKQGFINWLFDNGNEGPLKYFFTKMGRIETYLMEGKND